MFNTTRISPGPRPSKMGPSILNRTAPHLRHAPRPASTNREKRASRFAASLRRRPATRSACHGCSSLNRTLHQVLKVQVQVQAQEPIRYYKHCYTVATLVGGVADTARFNTRGSRPPAGGANCWVGRGIFIVSPNSGRSRTPTFTVGEGRSKERNAHTQINKSSQVKSR